MHAAEQVLEAACRANPGDVRVTSAMAKLYHGPMARPAQAEALQEDVFLKVVCATRPGGCDVPHPPRSPSIYMYISFVIRPPSPAYALSRP